MISKNIQSYELKEINHRDLTASLVTLEGKRTAVLSVYLDITQNAVPEFLDKAIQYCKQKRFAILIGIDTNAHHTVWGDSSNARGNMLFDYITEQNITIHNTTKDYTYECQLGKSVIDLTLSLGLRTGIHNWHVNKNLNHSDHHTIEYTLDTEIENIAPHRPWGQADWNIFKTLLADKNIEIPDIITPRKLEKMVDKLYKIIEKALDKACPMTEEMKINRNNPWFKGKLKELRKEVIKHHKNFIINPTPGRNTEYKRALRTYKKLCAKEKLNYKRNYTSEIDNIEEMSKYANKILNDKCYHSLSSIKKPDGLYTTPGEETLKEMASTHYPTHTHIKHTEYPNTSIKTEDLNALYEDWINVDRIKLALNAFQSKKSPGPDQLKPILLKHLPDNIVQQLKLIYKATIALQFTPTQWKNARVIYIPKPGKDDYTKAKSFRPISLTNYLVKTLEKLCVWKMDEALVEFPIHDNQQGFRQARSTEVALSHTINHIEKAFADNQHCLGLFLDIQAAFDSINPQHIKNSLLKHGSPEDLAGWYYNYLVHRNLFTTDNKTTIEISASQGFPQGGVCSAKFWNIAL